MQPHLARRGGEAGWTANIRSTKNTLPQKDICAALQRGGHDAREGWMPRMIHRTDAGPVAARSPRSRMCPANCRTPGHLAGRGTTLAVGRCAAFRLARKSDRILGVIRIVRVVVNEEADECAWQRQGEKQLPDCARQEFGFSPTWKARPVRLTVSHWPKDRLRSSLHGSAMPLMLRNWFRF